MQLNSIIFTCGDKSKHVPQSEVIEREFPFKFKGEEVFTSAVLNVTQENRQPFILSEDMEKEILAILNVQAWVTWQVR